MILKDYQNIKEMTDKLEKDLISEGYMTQEELDRIYREAEIEAKIDMLLDEQ